MVELFCDWVGRYPVVSIEDGLAEDDWDGWRRLTEALGARVQLVGDDLFTTNLERLDRGIGGGEAHSLLVKKNHNGGPTRTLRGVCRGRAGADPRAGSRRRAG